MALITQGERRVIKWPSGRPDEQQEGRIEGRKMEFGRKLAPNATIPPQIPQIKRSGRGTTAKETSGKNRI